MHSVHPQLIPKKCSWLSLFFLLLWRLNDDNFNIFIFLLNFLPLLMVHYKGVSFFNQIVSPALQHFLCFLIVAVSRLKAVMHSQHAIVLASLLELSLDEDAVKSSFELNVLKVFLNEFYLVDLDHELMQVYFFVEDIQIFQGLEEIMKIADIVKGQYCGLKELKDGNSSNDHTQSANHYHKIPDKGEDFVGKEIDEQVAEPFEQPEVVCEVRHFEHVGGEDRVHPCECVAEDEEEHVVERKFVFVHAEKQVSSTSGQVHKHLEGVLLGEAKHQQVANDEVEALAIAHLGEMVGNSLQDECELPQCLLRRLVRLKGLEGAADILLNLFPNLMVDQ